MRTIKYIVSIYNRCSEYLLCNFTYRDYLKIPDVVNNNKKEDIGIFYKNKKKSVNYKFSTRVVFTF